MEKTSYSVFLYQGLLIFFLVLTLHTPSLSQINVSGYNHVALSVQDINISTAFYKDIIGLKPLAVPDDLKAIRSWFVIGPGQELHLLAGRTKPVCDDFNDKNGSHVALKIPDVDACENFLKLKNIPYRRQQRFDGAWQIYITDPDGYVIEFNEPKK